MNTMQNPRMQAQALKRMGRGPDTQLIHMTDSEIDALNGLSALVFKEPLRTNPETGLPEAGLFKRLLPTVLAIGAATFLGPGAGAFFGAGGASGLGLSTGLATGLGTGLTAFGGHLAGQALSGQDMDFGRAALAGAGSGLLAGYGAASDAATLGEAAKAKGALAGVTTNPATGLPDYASATIKDASLLPANLPAADVQTALDSMAAGQATGLGGYARTFEEAGKFLGDDLLMNVGAPLGVAALTGEFDEPLPEAPAGDGDRREPFVPTALRASRERRDIDRDEDGEVTQEDIMEVVQGLPEGQSSRFYTPMQYTPLSTGGLVNLEQGGSIKAAIQNLTGGEGSTILPILAQAVVKPGEEEEEEATTKGYPLGTPGTPPGMPATGIAIGGGQPPQPFQAGGSTDADDVTIGSGTATPGEFGSSVVGLASEAVPSTMGGALGTGLSTAGKAAAGIGMMSPPGLAITGLGYLGGKLFDFLAPDPPPPAPPPAGPIQGPPTAEQAAEQAEAEDAAAAAAAAAAMAGIGMDLGDQPEDFEDGNPSVPGSQTSVAQAMANVVSGAPSIGGPSSTPSGTPTGGGGSSIGDSGFGTDSGPGSGFGDSGFGGPGGEEDADSSSSSGADAADGAGPGGDGSDTSAADDVKTGGQVGIGMQRLLKFEQGGLAGVPYFEGRVMPTGDPKEDGMSDNIPFVIAGQEGGQMGTQPAILSPDEYVIPADVVSMLGNGSSTAGSNQLDQFISNFRMDKYGRPKQPPEMRGGLSSLA